MGVYLFIEEISEELIDSFYFSVGFAFHSILAAGLVLVVVGFLVGPGLIFLCLLVWCLFLCLVVCLFLWSISFSCFWGFVSFNLLRFCVYQEEEEILKLLCSCSILLSLCQLF